MKKDKAKRIVCMAVCLLSLANVTANPVESAQVIVENEIMPLWDNTAELSNNVYFYDGTGYIEVSVTGKSGTTYIEGTVTLYRKSGLTWQFVDSWSDSVSGTRLIMQEEFDATEGVKYKVVFEGEVTLGGTAEALDDEVIKTYS